MIEPVFEKINYNQRIDEVKEQIKVECKTEISSSAVSSILSVWPWATTEETDLADGKLKHGGKITFYISYLDSDGAIKKCECGSEFSGEFKSEQIKDTCRAQTSVFIDKTEADTSGSFLSVVAYLTVKAELTDCGEMNALIGGEKLVIKEEELSTLKSLGLRKSTYPIEEEFELTYPVQEVLFHRADAVITAVQSGVGCIIVDGEVLLSLITLQKNEKSDIIRENRLLPFRMEIECEEAMPNTLSVARVKEKSFKTDISVDEESGRSVVSASVTLAFEGETFVENNITVATDVFSTENEVETIKENCPFNKFYEIRSYNAVISGRAETGELPVGASILAVGGEKANILSETCSENGLEITGVLTAVVYLRDGDGRIFTRKLETPFEKSFEGTFDCGTVIDKCIRAERASAKIVSVSEIEIEAEIYLTVYPQTKCENKIIKEIKVLEEKQTNDCAISVYIPMEGEELFSLAKRLNICPDALIATNKDLQFPLTGKERIVVYRKR